MVEVQWSIEMEDAQAVILPSGAASGDDQGLHAVFELFVAATGASWACLVLRSRRSRHVRTLTSGREAGPADVMTFQIDGDTTAELRLPVTDPPPADVVDAFVASLGGELHRLRLVAETTLIRAVLQATSSAVLLFGSTGEILFANPPADRLLSRQTEDELAVIRSDGRRTPLFGLICSRVGQLLDGTRRHAWRERLELSDGSELASEVVLLESGPEGLGRVVLSALRDLRHPLDALVDDFSHQHRLSPREREVLKLLVQGHDTRGLADRLGISPHTVRDHLKNVFRKTDNRSRSELLSALTGAGSNHKR